MVSNRFILTSLITLVMTASSQSFAALEVPDQFKSTNAAVILGLDKDPELAKEKSVLTKVMVKKAAQRLSSKYHPDKYMDTKKYSDHDRKAATEITQKVIAARQTLEDWLDQHPDFNPTKQDMDERPSSFHRGKSENYSWADIFGEREARPPNHKPSATKDIVTEAHFGGSSMQGTLFEFLNDYPNYDQAFIPLNVRSLDINQKMDALMIIDPAIFPLIEIKYFSKDRDGKTPQLVESVFAKYVRGHHQNGGGGYTDGIVLPNGNYLMDPLKTGRPARPLKAAPMDAFGKKLMIEPNVTSFFLEMKPTGYSANRSYTVIMKDQKGILPATRENSNHPVERLEGWKNATLPTNEGVIRLGYEPSKISSTQETPSYIEKHQDDVGEEEFKDRKLKFGIVRGKLDSGSLEVLNHALRVVGSAAPSKFSAELSLKGPFDFMIEVTDSIAAEKDIAAHRAQGAILNSTADAYTLVLADHPNGPFIVRLLWDKIIFETDSGKWVERPDAFVRLVAALSHEIYGNVRTFSERAKKTLLSPDHSYSDKYVKSDQIKFELAAFRAGVETLDRLIVQTKKDSRFPQKTLEDLQKALKRERESLALWEQLALKSGVSGTCKELLNNKLKGLSKKNKD